MSLSLDTLRPNAPYLRAYAHASRAYAMPASGDPAAWQAWRTAFRAQLRQRLGGLPAERGPISATVEQSSECDGYTRQLLVFESAPSVQVPAWLLLPHGLNAPTRAVIAAHGHGIGADDLVGLPESTASYHKNFAVELVRRGMVVLAPEFAGFGRRREPADIARGPGESSCHAASWWAIMEGKTLLGGRVWDALRGFDLLASMPQVDAKRISIMGGSGGGAVALFTAALEPALAAVVVSGYFCSYSASILAMPHCHCNYVPGLLEDGEIYDIGALIAPRPFLVESGQDDPIFPLPGVLDAYGRLEAAYSALGAAPNLHKDIFPGGHQIGGAVAFDFLAES